jgi:hypothetical protein
MWRSNYDCIRNSKNNLGHYHFSTKEMHKLSSNEVAEKLKKEKNIDWNDSPGEFKWVFNFLM